MSIAVNQQPIVEVQEQEEKRAPISARAYELISDRRSLWRGYLLLLVVSFVYIVNKGLSTDPVSLISALMIFATAVVPAGMWASGKIPGLPLYPIYALTFIPTFSIPLLQTAEGSRILLYQPEAHLSAAIIIVMVLILMTVAWRLSMGKPRRYEKYFAVSQKQALTLCMIGMTVSTLFVIGIVEGWWWQSGIINIPRQYFVIIRTGFTVMFLACLFPVFFLWGRGRIGNRVGIYAMILLIVTVLCYNAGLVLAASFTYVLVAFFGYTMGRQRVPIITMIIVLSLLTLLHLGKDDMRRKYRQPFGGFKTGVQGVSDLPRLYTEWVQDGIYYLRVRYGNEPPTMRFRERSSLLERSSLMHIFLDIRTRSPEIVPHMNGTTYAVIPKTLVPRFINPNKPPSHESTYMMNIHYGYQTRAATKTTTIGWGIFNEAFANFGVPGMLGMAIIVGCIFGGITRLGSYAPLLSVRFIVAVFIMLAFLRTESPVSALLPSLTQALSVLLIGYLLIGRMRKPQDPIIG